MAVIANENRWLNDLPRRWKMRLLKHKLRKITDGAHISPDTSESVYPFVSTVDIKKGVINFKTCLKTSSESYLILSNQGCQPMIGDVLFSKDGTVGKTVLISYDREFVVASSLIILTPANFDVFPAFLEFMLRSHFVLEQINSFVKGSALKRVSLLNIKKVIGIFPPIEEQQRIAFDLIKTCASIDTTITIKQKQLETMDALKKSIIHKAVTQGLDDAVELKDSGVAWLGKIPSGWKVKRIKDITQIMRGKFSHRPRNDPRFYGGEYPFIQTGEVTGAKKYIQSYRQTLNEEGYRVSKEFPKGTLVMTIAANIGDVAILNFRACFPDSIVGFYPGHKTDVNYLYYLFVCMRPALLSTAVLTTQLNLNNVKIGSLYSVLPSKSEQIKIASHLDKRTSQIEKLKKNIIKQIETLELYRKSIVHECVTGKRRITENDLKGP